MGEYQQTEFEKLPPKSKHVIICDDEIDNLVLEDVDLQRSKIDNLGLKRAKIKNCRFVQSVIKDCYLREAEFINVDFTGSQFINCNLERAKFKSCNFRYVTFSGCRLNIQEILGSLPCEPNLLRGVLRELRRNEEGMGERKTADLILIKEIKAERTLFYEEFRAQTYYFKDKATCLSRFLSLIRFLLSHLENMIWGYGLKLSRLMVSVIIIIFIFATGFYFTQSYNVSASEIVPLSIEQALYLSAIIFSNLGYGEYVPLNTIGKFLLCVESLFGVIFIGFVAAAAYRRISR